MSNSTSPLRWGILATGLIAGRFADGVAGSADNRLVAVASRSMASAKAFAQKHNIPRAHEGYAQLLADPDVQAIYVATPHPMHAEWAIRAAQAGKHVLVEKPIGLNTEQAAAIIDAAAKHHVFLMEAFMYRCHPQTARIVEIVRSGTLGELRMIEAEFSYDTDNGDDSRHFSQALGGGGILDVGCYPTSFARLIAGVAVGRPFDNPVQVKAVGTPHPRTGVDAWTTACLKFASGIIAQCTTGLKMPGGSRARIVGTTGWLEVPNPWVPGRDGQPTTLILRRNYGTTAEEITVPYGKDLYTYEAEQVSTHVADGQAPAMPWDDTLGNMRTLDAWRAEVGLTYDSEKPAAVGTLTITGRPLTVRPDAPMTFGRLSELDKPVSRLVMGADSNSLMPFTAIMFDEFFASGGNVFDTSYGYGVPNGACERNLGQWIRSRGIRDQVVVIEKGGNPPCGTPEGIRHEALAGLGRLQMDHVDLWLMHRDNPVVPVGELVDVMNELRDRGLCTLFGVSNWSLERLREAHAYCQRTGKTFFAALSNQLSLARMVEGPWASYLCSSFDVEFRRWLTEVQLPLMPWSSQARGFFTDRAGPDKFDDPEIVRCWYAPDNFARRHRACELAKQRNVEPINIALAWALQQPFPTFPLIGARRHRELWSCVNALSIKLSTEELAWLEGA